MVRDTSYLFCSICLLAITLSLAACGGGDAKPVGSSLDQDTSLSDADLAAAPFTAGFPAPSSLQRSTSEPQVNDLIVYAYSYIPAIPYANVNSGGFGLQFTSTYDPELNAEFSTLAYAGYGFWNLDGYSGEFGMRLNFSTPPQDFDTVFLGVSDWTSDSWKWFGIPEDSYVPMPSFGNYISEDGILYAVLVLMADDTCELEWLILGDRLEVIASLYTDLDLDPTQNIAPRLVEFNASSSVVFGGEIVSYDFDWQDDGFFDVPGDEDGIIQHTYNTPGVYTARVRAWDDLGNFGDDTVEFTIIDPENELPVAAIDADVTVGTAPQEVNLDASGSTDDKGIILYEWDLDGDGEFDVDTGDTPQITTVVALAGTTNLGVRVTDIDYATDTATVGISLPNGFSSSVIANVQNTWQLSAAICGTEPSEFIAVAIGDSEDHDLLVARSENIFGQTWLGPYLAAPADDRTGLYPTVVKGQFGNPIVVFAKSDSGDFIAQSVYATDHDCDSWFDPVDIDTFSDFYFDITANVIDGKLMAYISTGGQQGTGSSVYMYPSLNGSGTNWEPPVLVYHEPSSAGIYGLNVGHRLVDDVEWPVLSMVRSYFGETIGGMAVVVAADHDGATWGAPTWFLDFAASLSRVRLVNSRPAVVCSSTSADRGVRYVRSDSPDGTSWPDEIDELSGLEQGAYADMGVANGVPVICYFDYDLHKLMYMTAGNADGSVWNEPFIVASGTNFGWRGAMVIRGGVAPIIIYQDFANGTINCASWL